MDAAKTFDRLGELPPEIAKLLRPALEYTRDHSGGERTNEHRDAELALYTHAFTAIGWTRHDPSRPDRTTVPYSERAIPRASELTPVQRIVAEIVAHVDAANFSTFPIPAAAWARRQWLGLERGPLFELELAGVPAYHAVREAVSRESADRDALLSLIAMLPVPERLMLLFDLELARLDCRSATLSSVLHKLGADANASMGPWARVQADRLLALFAPTTPSWERGQANKLDFPLKQPVILALIRAGIALAPRWYELLPLSRFSPDPALHAIIDAVPEADREAALVLAISKVRFDVEQLAIARKLLPRYPYRALADIVLAKLEEASKPKDLLAELEQLARLHPPVAAAIAAKGAPALGPALVRGPERTAPPLAELSAIDRAQLELAQQRYGGTKLTVEQLYATHDADEVVLPSTATHIRVELDGAHVYDAWLYMVDSGIVFRAGTTEVVAEIIQTGVECRDRKLGMALKEVLARSAAKKPAATKKPPAKKPPAASRKPATAKKPAAKKPPAVKKKPVAKKPVARKPVAKRPVAKKQR